MNIKAEVKRRTRGLNQYILELKQKVYERRYKEAKNLLTNRKQSVNNSYMAPYDPNVYLLDSLKAKNQKLVRQRESVQQQIYKKLEEINKIKLKRGYRRDSVLSKPQNQQSYEFTPKIEIEEVGFYASRFPLKLEDVEKIDYELATLQTDFQLLKIIVDESSISFAFKQVISIETDETNILLCWKTEKPDSKSYAIIRFQKEEDRKHWARCVNFAKLISESQLKQKLFFKEDDSYLINIKAEQEAKQIQQIPPPANKPMALNIGSNRSSALDRLRRKSEYYPTLPTINNLSLINPTLPGLNNLSLINRSKLRKVSEDLSMKQTLNRSNYMYERKMGNEKSQKSFEDQMSQANSVTEKKQQNKKDKQIWKDPPKKNQPNNKIQKLKEQRQKLMESKMNQNNNTQSNRQIFFNQSSIHWIEQENQEMNSRSSQPSKNLVGKKNILDMLNKDQQAQQQHEKSQHISEAPAEIQESPLLPYSIRDKAREKSIGSSTFQVRIKEVPMTRQERPFKLKDIQEVRSQRSHRSRKVQAEQKSNNLKYPKVQTYETQIAHENSFQNEIEQEEDEENKENEIESINEQSADDDSQYDTKKPELKLTQQIEDKSQDIASENQNSETQSRKYGLDDLKSGITLWKCSPNAWNHHVKKLSLSNNDTQLCYRDEKGDNLKKINLSDIDKIDYNIGTVTEGILKHIKNYKKERCMVIKYKQDNKPKLLQFYLPNDKKIESLQQFYQKLNSYVVYKNAQP